MKHKCHISNCDVKTKPSLLMCSKHWKLVPQKMKDDVWNTYREGQCDDKKPSRDWVVSAMKAIRFVQDKERT